MRKKMKNNQEKTSGVHTPYCLCLHAVNGRTVIPKICIHNYECCKCAFDQWLELMEQPEEMVPIAV